MKVLLDTHVVLWMFGGTRRMSERASQAIATASEMRFSSIVSPSASAWEITANPQFSAYEVPVIDAR